MPEQIVFTRDGEVLLPVSLQETTAIVNNEGVFDNGTTIGDFTFDLSNGRVQKMFHSWAEGGDFPPTYSFSNPVVGREYLILITNGLTNFGGQVPYVFSDDIVFKNGVAPRPTEALNHQDIYRIMYDGTRYHAYLVATAVPTTDVRIAVGSFIVTSGAPPTVTFDNECGFRPKAVIAWTCGIDTVDGQSSVRDLNMSIGIATGPAARYSIGCFADDAALNADTAQRLVDTGIIVTCNNTGAETGRIDVKSFDASKWVAVVDDQLPVTLLISWIAFGGNGLQAELGSQVIGAGTGNESYTGGTFQPDFVCVIGNDLTALNTGAVHASYSVGFITATGVFNGHVASGWHEDAAAIMQAKHNVNSTEFWCRFNTTDVPVQRLDTVSLDAAGFTYNRLENDGVATSLRFLMLKGVRVKSSLTVIVPTSLTTVTELKYADMHPLAYMCLGSHLTNEAQDVAGASLSFSLGAAAKRYESDHLLITQTVQSSFSLDGAATDDVRVQDAEGIWVDPSDVTSPTPTLRVVDFLDHSIKIQVFNAAGSGQVINGIAFGAM